MFVLQCVRFQDSRTYSLFTSCYSKLVVLPQIERTADLPRHTLNFWLTLIYFRLLKLYLQINLQILLPLWSVLQTPNIHLSPPSILFHICVTYSYILLLVILLLETEFFKQKYVLLTSMSPTAAPQWVISSLLTSSRVRKMSVGGNGSVLWHQPKIGIVESRIQAFWLAVSCHLLDLAHGLPSCRYSRNWTKHILPTRFWEENSHRPTFSCTNLHCT